MTSRGYSLIELLVVLLIIGILSAIALPSFLNQRTKAEIARADSIAATISRAVWGYRLEHGQFPADTLQNEPPIGLEDIWVEEAIAPLDSPFDYDHHNLGDGNCLAQVTWFGQNGRRDTSAYEWNAQGDDRVIVISIYPCEGNRGRVR